MQSQSKTALHETAISQNKILQISFKFFIVATAASSWVGDLSFLSSNMK